MEDPKKLLNRRENYLPEYINMAPYSDAKRIFEKGRINHIYDHEFENDLRNLKLYFVNF